MATQSSAPPSTDQKPQNPVSDDALPALEDQKNMGEPTKENSPTSVFVSSEPMREDQVQNAVKFLSHPKVRGSPVVYRRSFLERKGLTKEEIDEAFHRVPDPPPAVSNVPTTNQDGQVKSSSNIQPQPSSQTLQPAVSAPAGAITKVGTLSRFHWSHALLAVGLLAVSGAGTALVFKNTIIPRLKSWIRKVVMEGEEEDLVKKTNSKPSLAEEAAAAAKAAAAAAADVARVSQEMLVSKTEERRYFKELMDQLDAQVREMKSMSNAIQKLTGQSNTSGRIPHTEQVQRVSVTSSRQSYANGRADIDLHSVRSSSPPAPVEPYVAPHPKSYTEEINDLPPNPCIAPKLKPWEVDLVGSQENGDGLDSNFLDYGHMNQTNGDNSVPWLQRRNVRITEIETEDERKTGSSGVLTNERPVQRSWVPPQPPPIAMPEAAVAIRQPKKPSFQREQLTDDQLLAHSSDTTNELHRITKISESGGVEEANHSGGISELNRSET